MPKEIKGVDPKSWDRFDQAVSGISGVLKHFLPWVGLATATSAVLAGCTDGNQPTAEVQTMVAPTPGEMERIANYCSEKLKYLNPEPISIKVAGGDESFAYTMCTNEADGSVNMVAYQTLKGQEMFENGKKLIANSGVNSAGNEVVVVGYVDEKGLAQPIFSAEKNGNGPDKITAYDINQNAFSIKSVANLNTEEGGALKSINSIFERVAGFGVTPVSAEYQTPTPLLPTETPVPTQTEEPTATAEVANDLLKDIIPIEEVKKNIEWFMGMSPEEIEKYVKDNGGLFGYGDPVSTLPLGMTAHGQIVEGPISNNGNRLGYITTTDNKDPYLFFGQNAVLLGFVGKELNSKTEVFTVLGIQDGCGKPHVFVGYFGSYGDGFDNESYKIQSGEAKRGNFLNISLDPSNIPIEEYLKDIGKNSIGKIVAVHQGYKRSEFLNDSSFFSTTLHSENNVKLNEVLKESIINQNCVEDGSLDPFFFDEMTFIDENKIDSSMLKEIPLIVRLISQ